MAWRKTVNIKEFIREGDQSPEGARVVAGQIASLLRSKLRQEIEGTEDFTLDLIVEELEDLSGSSDATVEDLDHMLSELYDWADGNRVWLGI